MGLSDSHSGPACPSRASGWLPSSRPWSHGSPPEWISRVASVFLANMPSPLPRRTREALGCSALFSPRRGGLGLHSGGLPPWTAGSASASFVSRPARRSHSLRPAGLLSRLTRPVDIESFSRFVTSSSVPTATGWNNPTSRAGLSPAGKQRLSRRTVRGA